MEQKFLLCYKRNRNITFQTGGIFMKTSRKRLLCLILCLLMILSCVPIVGAEEGASGPDDAEELRLKRKAAMRDDEIELAYDSDTIYTGKWTTLAEDGTYSVELHSFVTGDDIASPLHRRIGKPKFNAPTNSLAQAKAHLCKGLAKRCRR
jgi:hypothetical protein